MSIWIQKGRLLTGCLLNAAVFSVFSFPLPSIFQPVCALFSCVSLKVSTFTGDHPLQTGTTLASGSRDLDGKGLKPKGRGGRISTAGMKSTAQAREPH